MKTYNITTRVSSQARKELERIISTHEKYKNCFCFSSASSARYRRYNEGRFAYINPDVCFIKNDSKIVVKMSYKESCKNVYYKLSVILERNEEKSVKNISLLKKLLEK